ncbi:hypothetical protein Ep4_007 [Pseudomonas phage Ep4]|uniref:Terminase large subunit n=1 Tax=Pseudomonas phage Ep4 TaxID=3057492 RepID=A0AAU9EEA5_9CAUD|nr:hypothetical protein Ep4_007 [Pseudomonas phage Ep4]
MKTTFSIAPTVQTAAETAGKTRKQLAQWVAKQDQGPQETLAKLDAGCIKAAKAEGACYFNTALADRIRSGHGLDFLYSMVGAFYQAVRDGLDVPEGDCRSESYVLEGMANAFSKAKFSSGLEFTAEHQQISIIAPMAAGYTLFDADKQLVERIGVRVGGTYERLHTVGSTEELLHSTVFSGKATRVAARTAFGKRCLLPGAAALVLPYMDVDGMWVAGFLSAADTSNLRFSRKRLGAWLAEAGIYSDEEVRQYVEQGKTAGAGGVAFEFFPNDRDWADLYVGMAEEVDSCMSYQAAHWELGPNPHGDDAHPVSAYSSAYWGSGDNELALLVSRDAAGNANGRGIVHTGRMRVVRWYGDYAAFRAIERLGIETDDEVLGDAWLAYIPLGGRFLHPYVDGCCGYGMVDEEARRVYLTSGWDEDIAELQVTDGASRRPGWVYCQDNEEYAPKDDAVWQPGHGNYRSRDPVVWLCPVLHEYVPEYARRSILLDGEVTVVSDRARAYCIKRVRAEDVPAKYLENVALGERYYTRTAEQAVKELEWQLEQNQNPQQMQLLVSPDSCTTSSVSVDHTAEQARPLRSPSLSSGSLARAEAAAATLWGTSIVSSSQIDSIWLDEYPF